MRKHIVSKIFRGVFNYYKGNTKKLTLNYKKSLQTLCKEVDGVICSNNEQQKKFLNLIKIVIFYLKEIFIFLTLI